MTGALHVEELTQHALTVAREAAAILRSGYRSRPRAAEKGKRDLVTEFDLRSEAHIMGRLRELSPRVAIIGEETGGEPTDDPVWICDPLDGTTNFVHGHPFFAVSIGLAVARTPVLGAVVAPALGVEWWGFRSSPDAADGAAFRDGVPCRVSDTASVADAMLATGFPPDRSRAPENNFDTFAKVKKQVLAVRRCGAAAIDCCFVGDATYDAYWERRVHAWDLAAGCAIALAAGATLTAMSGAPVDLFAGNVLLSNQRLHAPLVELIRDE